MGIVPSVTSTVSALTAKAFSLMPADRFFQNKGLSQEDLADVGVARQF